MSYIESKKITTLVTNLKKKILIYIYTYLYIIYVR